MKKYRFFDEGTGETLKILESPNPLTWRQIDRAIEMLETQTSLFVLWEDITDETNG